MKKGLAKICEWIGLPGALIIIFCAAMAWLVLGCAANKQSGDVAAGTTPSATEKGGAQLWAENCVRCHNIRSPSNYSPAQWEVVMMHMRVRANLTPEEHKKILEFLKSGS
jgi:mono/diheme cytochrome c family protein